MTVIEVCVEDGRVMSLRVNTMAPILIAYDGSAAARDAVRKAGELFPSRRAIVLTIWEPGLNDFMLTPDPTGMGTTMLPYNPELVREIARANEDHAGDIAADGQTLATASGLQAEVLVVRDETVVADAIVAQANEHDVAIIVIGSRGLTGLKSMLLGSTSKHLLERSSRPVLVVRHPEDHEHIDR
jgi:nucleotide-binding universal stress UspA family protein